MSYKIENIYETIYTKVASVLSDHTELIYSGEIELNNDLYLRKGFAIQIGSGTITRRFGVCHYSIARDITVTNTLSNYGYETNKTSKKTIEKALLANQMKIIDAIEKDNQLSNYAMKVDFTSDGGIEYIHIEQKNYIMTRSVFNIEYEEKI